MSIDYRDPPQPALTTIYLDDGHVEIFAPSSRDASNPQSTTPPSDPSAMSSDARLPSSTNLYVPTPALTISTVTYLTTVTTSPTSTIFPTNSPDFASSGSTINSQSLSGLSLVAVVALPLLVLMVISSMVLLCCRARQRRKTRCGRGGQGKPQGTSVFAALKGSFIDQHKTLSVQHSAYFPAVTVSRDPSPTPETRGRPSVQPSNPQPRDTVVSDPPPPYVLQPDSLRPPSMYGRIHTRSPSPTLSEANLSVHDDATLRSPFGSPYLGVESDALSDISIERGYSLRRQRDTDEVSFVSALEPDEHVERDLHYIV